MQVREESNESLIARVLKERAKEQEWRKATASRRKKFAKMASQAEEFAGQGLSQAALSEHNESKYRSFSRATRTGTATETGTVSTTTEATSRNHRRRTSSTVSFASRPASSTSAGSAFTTESEAVSRVPKRSNASGSERQVLPPPTGLPPRTRSSSSSVRPGSTTSGTGTDIVSLSAVSAVVSVASTSSIASATTTTSTTAPSTITCGGRPSQPKAHTKAPPTRERVSAIAELCGTAAEEDEELDAALKPIPVLNPAPRLSSVFSAGSDTKGGSSSARQQTAMEAANCVSVLPPLHAKGRQQPSRQSLAMRESIMEFLQLEGQAAALDDDPKAGCSSNALHHTNYSDSQEGDNESSSTLPPFLPAVAPSPSNPFTTSTDTNATSPTAPPSTVSGKDEKQQQKEDATHPKPKPSSGKCDVNGRSRSISAPAAMVKERKIAGVGTKTSPTTTASATRKPPMVPRSAQGSTRTKQSALVAALEAADDSPRVSTNEMPLVFRPRSHQEEGLGIGSKTKKKRKGCVQFNLHHNGGDVFTDNDGVQFNIQRSVDSSVGASHSITATNDDGFAQEIRAALDELKNAEAAAEDTFDSNGHAGTTFSASKKRHPLRIEDGSFALQSTSSSNVEDPFCRPVPTCAFGTPSTEPLEPAMDSNRSTTSSTRRISGGICRSKVVNGELIVLEEEEDPSCPAEEASFQSNVVSSSCAVEREELTVAGLATSRPAEVLPTGYSMEETKLLAALGAINQKQKVSAAKIALRQRKSSDLNSERKTPFSAGEKRTVTTCTPTSTEDDVLCFGRGVGAELGGGSNPQAVLTKRRSSSSSSVIGAKSRSRVASHVSITDSDGTEPGNGAPRLPLTTLPKGTPINARILSKRKHIAAEYR